MPIDYLIKNGLIIDGADNDAVPYQSDIAIEGDRIKAIGDLSDLKAKKTIDARGLCVCPGFIDVHSHSEFELLADGRASAKVCQGITTEINGNCGLSAAPLIGAALEQREEEFEKLNIKDRWQSFSEYFSILENRGFAVNFVTLAGHGNIRASASGYVNRPLTEGEMRKSLELLREAMADGAKGLSTGLIYPPGIYTETSELVTLARESAAHNGIYTTHMRSEGDRLLESVDEAIQIGREARIAVHISHLKTMGEKNWHKLNRVFERIENAHDESVPVTCDRYPYIAASTDLDAVLPSWAFEGGHKKELERLKNERERLEKDLIKEHPESSCWERVIVSTVTLEKNKWMEGKNITEIAGSEDKRAVDTIFDILIEEDLNVGSIFRGMNEGNLRSILNRPYVMLGSDSSARNFDGVTAKGKPHPRGFGSFPRVLGEYVRELKLLSLGEAVYKMTGLPARTFSLNRRGVLAKGNFADITIFDPEKVKDNADYKNPFQKSDGIYYVLVNGIPALYEGELTNSLPGRVIR